MAALARQAVLLVTHRAAQPAHLLQLQRLGRVVPQAPLHGSHIHAA